ncbi:MAG: hypothetical protein M3Y06_06605 [Actinomycetota bacterium]|nr:hypothetical protein [Actinomycetota bacterium]
MSTDAGTDASKLTTVIAWLGVAVVVGVGVLAGVLECELVPLYVGGTVFPIAVVGALVSNIVLPRMARSLVPTTVAAVLPFLGWLAVIIVFGAGSRPEGDVILPGGGALAYVSYGVMLGGALAGMVSIVTSAPPPALSSKRR